MWKMFIGAFITIFLAELGDKTQIAIFTMSAKEKSFLPVFLGASIAMTLSTLIVALIGSAAGNVVPEKVTRYVAGAVFIIFGALMLLGKV